MSSEQRQKIEPRGARTRHARLRVGVAPVRLPALPSQDVRDGVLDALLRQKYALRLRLRDLREERGNISRLLQDLGGSQSDGLDSRVARTGSP